MVMLTKLACSSVNSIRVPHTIMMPYRTNHVTTFYLPSMNFVENFVLIMYWNKREPNESVVELRYRNRLDGWGESNPIEPSLLKTILSDAPRYRDAIVELAHGRSFIKGLCGNWVAQLDTYVERTADSLAGSLVSDHGPALAIALSFPGKITSMWDAKKVHSHVCKIDEFVNEMEGSGRISSQIREYKTLILKKKKEIEELDIYNREDHKTFENGVEFLRKFGIEYDLSDD